MTATVGCGATAADLLDSQNVRVEVTGQSAGKTVDMTTVPNRPTGEKAWNTGDFEIALQVSISLENFVSNTPPGMATITVFVQAWTKENTWSAGEESSFTVNKEVVCQPKPEIRYFTGQS